MKHILFYLFAMWFFIIGCSSVKKTDSSSETQGITGLVTRVTGNQMPGPGATKPPPKGIPATILIYEPTHTSQVTQSGTSPLYTAINTRLVASVMSDSTGLFTVALPAGSYSLFVKQGKLFFANLFDTNNNISLFTVEEGKLTKIKLTVNSGASY